MKCKNAYIDTHIDTRLLTLQSFDAKSLYASQLLFRYIDVQIEQFNSIQKLFAKEYR